MVKSVLGVNHQGLRDWLVQRITAVVMVVYLVGLVGFFMAHSDLAYYEWHGLFGHLWMKIVTLLFVLCLLLHAWVGMWTIYTDYIKCFVLRLTLSSLTVLALVGFFLQALLILWSV